ncbi:putative bifunctional diguanylate cyclase/phosphodiesterase [Marinobacter sp.]|uniref:putative bifunctional diguanylate cyclase/phosphodiesterase n=1 Tax=Marinobacter sp. TaxID=50741 RepID=UPI0038501E43
MKLADYIRTHLEDILRVWEHDAASILSGRNLTRDELRNHVKQILLGVAAELERPETGEDRSGLFNANHPDSEAHASIHGASRHELGANIVHLAREFRALRKTVVQSWLQMDGLPSRADLDEVVRFNNEIDKALTRSVERYALETQKQSRLLETMLSSLPDPCYVLSADGEFLYANRAMAELCDLSTDEMSGRSLSSMPLPAHYLDDRQLQRITSQGEQCRGEVEIIRASGNLHCFEYVHAPVTGEEGRIEAISGIAHDVTARKETEGQVWRHANYDLLTGIPNRRLFRDRLDQHTAHSDRTGSPFALFFIDLDRFKEINDRLGHDSGDQLLKQAASRISGCTRQSDTVARLGGDEFTVILLDTADLDLVKGIANKILADLERPFHVKGEQVMVSGSIGITMFPADATSSQEMLSNADQAMYLAKQSGRNQVCFFTEIMRQAHSARQALIRELRDAPRDGQLKLYYQPIVELSSGRIAKAEALLRWEHPRQELLRPDAFLPLAEETGLMPSIEHWVFAEALFYAERWTDMTDGPFQLTINASPMQFQHNGDATSWDSLLKNLVHSGVNLAIELTENVFLHESTCLRQRLEALKEAGVELALDDFGTGYSSLAYLKRFDINYLKIDKTIIRDTEAGSTNREIAEVIIVMAHKLGLKVIAEGVETAAQRDWLREAGCDFAQGYFFSHPLAAEAFGDLLKSGSSRSALAIVPSKPASLG